MCVSTSTLQTEKVLPRILLASAPVSTVLAPLNQHANLYPAATWESRWKKSSWKEADGAAGEFKLSPGKWFGDEEIDKGIQTAEDSKFSTIYSEMPKTFDNTGKDLVVQVGTDKTSP